MARTPEGAALTAQHRTQQLAVRAVTLRDMTRLWSTWTPGDIAGFGRFVDLATSLISARHQQSAGVAAAYYRAFRAAERVGGGDTPRMPDRLTKADVAPSLRATALAGTMRAIRVGFSPQAAGRTGLVLAAGAAGRLALNGGRDLVVASTAADRRAEGWARVTAGGVCDFCAMAASRGPVFKSERTAAFEAHDHCACTAEPFYPGSQWPGRARQYAQLWDTATAGLSGAEARAAFRDAVRAGVPAPGDGLPGGTLAGGGRAGPGLGGPGQGGAGGGRPPAPPTGDGDDRDPEEPMLPPSSGLSAADLAAARELPARPATSGQPAPAIAPPSAAALRADAGLVADEDAPDVHFGDRAEELAIAALMRDLGFEVLSVQPRTGQRERTPDALLRVEGVEVAADFKTPRGGGPTAIRRAVRDGRGQARRVVINARPARIPFAAVLEGLRAAIRDYGAEVDEVLVLGTRDGRDYVLRWAGGGS